MAGNEFGKLSREDVESRYVDSPFSFYMQSVYLVKGAVFTSAAGVFLETFSGPLGPGEMERLIFFISTCCIVLIPIATYIRGAIPSSGNAKLFDYFAPFAMGFAEVMMFWSLSADLNLDNYRSSWLLAVALHAAFAVALLITRLSATRLRNYAEALRELVPKYRGWLGIDALGALAFSVSAFLLALPGKKWGLSTRVWNIHLDQVALPLKSISIEAYSLIAGAYGSFALAISAKALVEQREIGAWLETHPAPARS